MSTTLNLAHGLLARGILLQELGRTHDAQKILTGLLGLRELPDAVAREAHFCLAEIELQHRDYHRARRHLAAVLAHCPDDARYHHLMAGILDQDEDADPQRAYQHYRRSLQLNPNHAGCLGDFGLLALSLGENQEGLQALRRAAELEPDEPETIGKLVEGLCELDQADEARRVLWAALFRNPRHAGFRKLWSDFQFQQLQQAQEMIERSISANTKRPVILPFAPAQAASPSTANQRGTIRKDGASSPRPPHSTGPSRLPGKKRA
jgi:Tfp pilus assembly protein PilF